MVYLVFISEAECNACVWFKGFSTVVVTLWLWISCRTNTYHNVEVYYCYDQAKLLLSSPCSLANVDPIDVARNITGLNPETTLGKWQSFVYLFPSIILFKSNLDFIWGVFNLSKFLLFLCKLSSLGFLLIFAVVVVSKTFTTAETMLNARTLREWISAALGLVI